MTKILRDNKRKLAFLLLSWCLYGVINTPPAAAMEVHHAQ
jgi:hypothetical protein